MGDRAAIVVHYEDEEDTVIYFYSHWGGDIGIELARVLQRGERWDDPSYLARMVFCGLMQTENLHDTLSFGIGALPLPTDLDNPPYHLWLKSRGVSMERHVGRGPFVPTHLMSYEEFITELLDL